MVAYLRLLEIFLPKEEEKAPVACVSFQSFINRMPNILNSFLSKASYVKQVSVYEKKRTLLEELVKRMREDPEKNIKKLFELDHSSLFFSVKKSFEEDKITLDKDEAVTNTYSGIFNDSFLHLLEQKLKQAKIDLDMHTIIDYELEFEGKKRSKPIVNVKLEKTSEESHVVLLHNAVIHHTLEDVIFNNEFRPFVKIELGNIINYLLSLDHKHFACHFDDEDYYVYNESWKDITDYRDLEDKINKSLDKIKQDLFFMFLAYRNKVIPLTDIKNLIISYIPIALGAISTEYDELTDKEKLLRKNLFQPMAYLIVMFYSFVKSSELDPITVSKDLGNDIVSVTNVPGSYLVDKNKVNNVLKIKFDTNGEDYVYINPSKIIYIFGKKYVHEKDFVKPYFDGRYAYVNSGYYACPTKHLKTCKTPTPMTPLNPGKIIEPGKKNTPVNPPKQESEIIPILVDDQFIETLSSIRPVKENDICFKKSSLVPGPVSSITKDNIVEHSKLPRNISEADSFCAVSKHNTTNIKESNIFVASKFKPVNGEKYGVPITKRSFLLGIDTGVKSEIEKLISDFYYPNRQAIRRTYPPLITIPTKELLTN